MKQKLFLLLTAVLLSAGMVVQAQLLDAVNDSPTEGVYSLIGNDITESAVVSKIANPAHISGRNNAPQATYNVNLTFKNFQYATDRLGGAGGNYKLYLLRLWSPGQQYPYVDFQFGYTQLLDYGAYELPNQGTYSMITSVSYFSQISGRLFSNNNFPMTYSPNSSTAWQLYSGTVKLAAGRHGLPYLTTTSNLYDGEDYYNVTAGESRHLTTTYTSCRVATDEENGKAVLQAYDGTNTLTLVFNIASVDANIGIPAKQYTVGTDVWGGCTDDDGYTRWMFKSGKITISKSNNKLSMSTSSLKGTSSGSDFDMNLTISSKAPDMTFTAVNLSEGKISGYDDTNYSPFLVSGSQSNDKINIYMPFTQASNFTSSQKFAAFFGPDQNGDYASSSYITKNGTKYVMSQGVAVIDYDKTYQVAELTSAYLNSGTFYYIHTITSQVNNLSDWNKFYFSGERNAAFSATFSAATPADHDAEKAHFSVNNGSQNMYLTFYTDDTKDGVVPSGTYDVRATKKDNTVYVGTYSSGLRDSRGQQSSYWWLLRFGTVEVFNLNETYYITQGTTLLSARDNNITFTIGTAPKDVTLTTPAANGTAQIQFTATNWGNKVLTYASGTAHKFFQGQTLSLQATPASGYRVAYWTLGGVKINGSDAQSSYAYTVGAAATQTLAAVFEQASTNFHLAWDANGGVLVDNEVYSYAVEGDYPGGEELPDGTPNATREGYQLTGWYDAEHDLPFDENDWIMPSYDVTYTAQWTANTHNVSWVTDGNALTGTYTNGTTAYGTTIVAPETPTKNATAQYTYTFNGWTPAVDATMPDNDVTYTATWTETPVNYTLTWTTDGDALTGTYTSGTVAYGTAIAEPNTPTKTGYTFAGWDVTPASTMPAANTTYTAQWTPIDYEINFHGNGGTGSFFNLIYTIEDDAIDLWTDEDIMKANYTFGGWYDNADLTGDPVTTIPAGSTGNKDFYAKWIINTYTITWKDADGTTLETDENVAYGTTPAYNGSIPTKEADSEYTYAFNGWSPAVATVTTDATYTAAYSQTKVQYTLTWNFDGGTTATAEGNYTHGLIDWGTAITAPANPTKDGYTFNGWNTTPASTMPAANVTYTAQWVSASAPVVLYDYKDNDYYDNFKTMYNGKTINVTYERQFTKGRWSTLCLPFNVNKTLVGQLFGSHIYEFKYATGNANDDSGVNLYFSIAKSIVAGKGYIVNAGETLSGPFIFPGVTINLSADKGDELNSVEAYDNLTGSGATDGNIELVGTLRKGTLKGTDKNNRYMGLKDNKIYYPNITTGSTILAYRGIFRSIDGTLNAERIRIIVDGKEKAELEVINGELQDVQETKKFIENGVLYIERNGIIYDATGRKVE